MGQLFTPHLDFPNGPRVQMNISTEDFSKITRGLGYKGMVNNISDGKLYSVYGQECTMPGCQCDVYVVEVKTDKYVLYSQAFSEGYEAGRRDARRDKIDG